jgi:hypothetical protein
VKATHLSTDRDRCAWYVYASIRSFSAWSTPLPTNPSYHQHQQLLASYPKHISIKKEVPFC